MVIYKKEPITKLTISQYLICIFFPIRLQYSMFIRQRSRKVRLFMGKVDENKKKKRMDILNAAYDLFTGTGFYKTTIHDISKHAGVGKGTFYLYFDSKEDVRNELIMLKSSRILIDASNNLKEQQKKADQPIDIADRLICISDFILDYLKKDITLLKFISKNLTWGLFRQSDKYSGIDDEVLDFKSFIETNLSSQMQEIKNPDLLFFTLLELMNATCYNVILYNDPVPFEDYKPYLYGCIRRIVEGSLIS